MDRNRFFAQREFEPGEEDKWKRIYDHAMNPREWMARFGHNIICGDGRIYKYQDKEFEKWIYQAYEALTNEGLETLWNEFLTEEETIEARYAYENP
jgi:hypothetical protein